MLIPASKPSEKERYVHSLFAGIARRYDLLNTILSLGLDRYWRRRTVELMELKAGDSALDVACGTGMLLLKQASVVGARGEVVGVDFCQPMLDIARACIAGSRYAGIVRLVNANALSLPFPDGSFDGASVGFALRNLPDIHAAIAEMARVVRPGGRVVALEISKPTIPLFRQLFFLYFNYIVPLAGRILSGSKEPYQYLPESLKPLPNPEEIRRMFTANGLKDTHYYKLSGGIMCIHLGTVV